MIFNFPSIPLLSICLLDSVKSSDDDSMTRIAKKTPHFLYQPSAIWSREGRSWWFCGGEHATLGSVFIIPLPIPALCNGPGKEGAGGFVEENMQPLVWFSLSHFIYTVRKLLTDFAPTVGYG